MQPDLIGLAIITPLIYSGISFCLYFSLLKTEFSKFTKLLNCIWDERPRCFIWYLCVINFQSKSLVFIMLGYKLEIRQLQIMTGYK